MRILLYGFLVASILPIPVAGEALLILCDDDGTLSHIDDIAGIVDQMSPKPTYEVKRNNGYEGVYTSNLDYLNNFYAVFWYEGGYNNWGRATPIDLINGIAFAEKLKELGLGIKVEMV